MIDRMFAGIDGRTYANAANAEKALLKRMAPYDSGNEIFRYLIATDEHGRFFPVFLPSSEQIQVAINLAHHGIACARG